MIETETIWEDSGYDCDHCGGEIAKRIDKETGRPDHVCLQCKNCGCQWTMDGEVERVGTGPDCPAAQGARSGDRVWPVTLSRPLWILIGVIALFALIRFGGFSLLFSLLRFALPIGLIAAAAIYLVRRGREQGWW